MGIVTRQGRTQAPTEAEEIMVWDQWREANITNLESLDALEVMMLIAEQQHLALTAVWTLVKAGLSRNSGARFNDITRFRPCHSAYFVQNDCAYSEKVPVRGCD